MNESTFSPYNITVAERGTRIIVGFGLIAVVAMQTGTLGLSAISPLVAVYPMMTGFLGWDPLYAVFKKGDRRAKHQLPRVAMA